MEKETVLKTGKLVNILVMLISGISVAITSFQGFLSDKDYGAVIIAFGVFLVALRGYLKDHYGVF